MEKVKFTLRIEENKLKEMKIHAIEQNLHLNELIENLFDEYMENIGYYLKKQEKKVI